MSSSAPLHSSVMPMPDHPSACVRHPQILLDKKCLAGQLRNSTTAETNNSRGHHLEVTFKAVDPPAISLCLVSCVDQTGDRLLGQPRIVGVAGGFVLLAICFSDSVYNLCQFVDYFVYKAGPDFASLHLLARPYPSSFSLNLAAILPAGDNSKDFAVIFPHVEYFSLECRKHYTLHIYRSDVNAWHSQVAYISEDNETSNAKYRLLIHNAMSVAYAEKGIIAWIDLWWGILLCNVLDKKPIIRFVPLPVPEPCDPSEFCLLHQDLNPRPHRHVTILNDLIKFVEVDFHVEDVFNMKREKDYGWRAKTWTRSLYSNVWCDGLMFDTSEISCTDSSLSNILPDMFDEENNLTWNKLMSAGPTLSLHDDNIIYIMAKESRCHRTAYVLAVNIKSLKLESGAQCSAEKMLGFEPTYDSCVLFSSFGTTSELVKEFETKGTMFETKEGPALLVVSKRLRMLRKKQNRIAQMEESVAAGKMLNQEQKEVMHSKPVIAALIDELERLRMPLSTALTKELSTAPGPAASRSSSFGSDLSIQDLLALIYFGSLFDVKSPNEFTATMVAHEHERSSCITHGYVWDDTMDLLTENDLDAVSAVAALAAARPVSAVGVSHHDALQACAHHARLWLARADVPIHPGSSVTYAAVRSKLDRIMTSDYYTAPAVGGNHGAEGLQAQMSMTVSPEALSLKENLAAEFHKEDEEDPSHATEIFNDHQCNAADVQNVDDNAPVNTREEYPVAEAEQEKLDVEEQDQRYGEPKERQFQHSRRSYQNQRGCDRGRRGAYPNGCSGHGGGHGVGNRYHNGRGGGGGYQGGGGGGHGMGSRYQNGRGGGGGYQGGGGGYQEGGRGMGSRYQSGRGGGGGYQGGGGGYQNCRGGGGGYQGGGGGYQNGRGGGGGGGWYYNNEDGYCQPRNLRNLNNRGRCAGRWPRVHRED